MGSESKQRQGRGREGENRSNKNVDSTPYSLLNFGFSPAAVGGGAFCLRLQTAFNNQTNIFLLFIFLDFEFVGKWMGEKEERNL